MDNEIKAKRIFKGLKFYDVLNVAKILDITPGVVRQYLREKRIKAVKIGLKWWISEKSINAFLGGGSFWDQSNDKIMDSINQAIKSTFEENVPWLAHKVKELIIDDLTKNFRENLAEINQIAGMPEVANKIMEDRKKKLKKEFQKV
ncbi:hypothetical protein ES703_17814 [subsurface metagenome]